MKLSGLTSVTIASPRRRWRWSPSAAYRPTYPPPTIRMRAAGFRPRARAMPAVLADLDGADHPFGLVETAHELEGPAAGCRERGGALAPRVDGHVHVEILDRERVRRLARIGDRDRGLLPRRRLDRGRTEQIVLCLDL